jgi:tetratricopeptide (TPR) repeat protein
MAKEISGNLRLKVSGAEQNRVTKPYTENPEAYQLYLKGRFWWNKRTGEALTKSIEYFNQAIEKDPGYSLAYAGIADAYGLLPGYSAGSPQECYPKAKAAASRALELDETLAEAHTALANVLIMYDWNLSESTREFKRAIELNPNYATAHQWYGIGNLVMTQHFEEAIAEGKRAQELDPFSFAVNQDLANTYIYARQYDKAIEQARKTVELDQNFYVAHWYLGMAYAMKGMLPDAIAEYQKARALDNDTYVLGYLGHAYASSGKREEALKLISQLKEIAAQHYVAAYSVATVYAGLGDKEQTFQWLEKSLQDRTVDIAYLKVDPFFDGVRSDPRFDVLVRRVGL